MSGPDSAENEDLAVRWAAVIGGPLPAGLSPERLARSLRYAEQVAADPALSRIDREINRRLKQLARQKAPVTPRRILPGTRLLREWRGATHDVLVTDQGYVYRGTTYRSLSAIAQIITGAHWSGPKFFGTA
jgi:hypothetical protein